MRTTTSSTARYEVGQRLVHYTGQVWEVIETDLPGDGKTWEGGMVVCEGDYRIRCVSSPARTQTLGSVTDRPGYVMRVHADYLHGDGWRRIA